MKTMALSPDQIRQAFPLFQQESPPIYFDTAATAQIPQTVMDAMRSFDAEYKANVHRGVHAMTEKATQCYEESRAGVQTFLNAKHVDEIIFTKNTTEAINLVAQSWGKTNLKKGDIIALSIMEHHSNIVPWQQLASESGVSIKWFEDDTELDEVLNKGNVKLVAITGESNVLGMCPDIDAITAKAHSAGALILVDAAQLAVHHRIDVTKTDCDFLAFSGHKLYGPTGIGVLYGKRDLLKSMPPYMGGGMMISSVTTEGFTPADAPAKFEAGTPPIAEAIGLHAALDWLTQYDWKDIEAHEAALITKALKALDKIKGVTLLPTPHSPRPAPSQSGCFSFTIEDLHPHDVTDILGQRGIALRAGHHCTQPLHNKLGIPASIRFSVGIYNTEKEIDTFAKELEEVTSFLR